MGDRCSQETQNQAGGPCKPLVVHNLVMKYSHQSIAVLPRKNRLRIYVDTQDKFYRLRELKRGLSDVVVKVGTPNSAVVCISMLSQGVPTIQRAVINIKDKDDSRGKKGDKELLVEGYGLQKCMIAEGQ
jgi:DNA-directed RNA polymerase III subunit RPC1